MRETLLLVFFFLTIILINVFSVYLRLSNFLFLEDHLFIFYCSEKASKKIQSQKLFTREK